jgi:CRISPR-associated protein Csm1
MSLQVFLQAQISGTEEFLAAQSSDHQDAMADLLGRCAWLTLACEVLPRALLAELKLSPMLLGSSSAEQFLLVLAEEDVARANEFLTRAAAEMSKLSGNTLRLVWASTENLGAWPIARKRLDDALLAKTVAPLAAPSTDLTEVFAPFIADAPEPGDSYFETFAQGLPAAKKVGCSAHEPVHLLWDGGQYSWALKEQSGIEDDGILFPRRFATDDTSGHLTPLSDLAQRASGAHKWGILRGDVDHFDIQLRRVNSIEEHIHLSVMFKEFFAGELALLCTLPDFWRKVTILYRGGEDFAVIGTWDALVPLARELQRLFEKLVEQNTLMFPNLESRSISMGMAVAPDAASHPGAIFQEAGIELQAAKASEVGGFRLFGRTLEWKRLADAEELKSSLMRLVRDFRFSPDYVHDLASVYRESFSARAQRRTKAVKIDKPWRTFMRLATVVPQGRGKELNNVRNAVITNLVGKKTAGLKLRPSGRVGLEWARLAAGDQK